MLSSSEFARLKAREARNRADGLTDTSVRQEWFAMARLWDELARGYLNLQTNQANPSRAAAVHLGRAA